MRHTLLLPVLLAATSGLLTLPCRAGGALGQSSVSQADAIRSATVGMLPGEVITSSNCTETLVDGSTLYSCDVQWGAPPAP